MSLPRETRVRRYLGPLSPLPPLQASRIEGAASVQGGSRMWDFADRTLESGSPLSPRRVPSPHLVRSIFNSNPREGCNLGAGPRCTSRLSWEGEGEGQVYVTVHLPVHRPRQHVSMYGTLHRCHHVLWYSTRTLQGKGEGEGEGGGASGLLHLTAAATARRSHARRLGAHRTSTWRIFASYCFFIMDGPSLRDRWPPGSIRA